MGYVYMWESWLWWLWYIGNGIVHECSALLLTITICFIFFSFSRKNNVTKDTWELFFLLFLLRHSRIFFSLFLCRRLSNEVDEGINFRQEYILLQCSIPGRSYILLNVRNVFMYYLVNTFYEFVKEILRYECNDWNERQKKRIEKEE